jgi:hypothetical protein
LAQFFQRRGRGFQMRTRGTSSSASDSTERVLNRSAAVVSVNRRCRLCFGRFATTLDFQLFQQYRTKADMNRKASELYRSRMTPRRHRRLQIAAMQLGFCYLRMPICTTRRRAGVSRLVRNRRRAPQPPIAWTVRRRRRTEPKDNRPTRTGRGQGIPGCHPRCRRR